MNSTDLRIAFKMDTGYYPLWAKNHDGSDIRSTTFIKGHPSTIYGLWLEDQIGKPKYLRDRYYKLNKDLPTKFYFGKFVTSTVTFHRRGLSRYQGTHDPVDVLYSDYILWLESFTLKFKPEIVSNIIGI